MANSTPYVLAAGGIITANQLIVNSDKTAALKTAAGTGLAAIVTAMIDKAVPGMGVGLGVLMIVVAVLTSAGPVLKFVNAGRTDSKA